MGLNHNYGLVNYGLMHLGGWMGECTGGIYMVPSSVSPPPPCGVVGVWYGMLGMYGVYGRSGMACLESMVCLVCMVGMVCMA